MAATRPATRRSSTPFRRPRSPRCRTRTSTGRSSTSPPKAGGAQYENITYEGYGPGGVAVLVECLTDNRNRAASDVRVAFTRNGGRMADPGSVSYLFNRKGLVIVNKTKDMAEDDVLMAVLNAGAEEVNDLGDTFEIVSEPTNMVAVRTALQEAGIDYEWADTAFLPSVEIDLDEDQARKVLRMIEPWRTPTTSRTCTRIQRQGRHMEKRG